MIWSDRGRARAAETSVSSVSVKGGQRVIGGVGLGEAGEGRQSGGEGLGEMGARSGVEEVSGEWCEEEGVRGVRGKPWRRLARIRLWMGGMHASTWAVVNGGAIMRYWDRRKATEGEDVIAWSVDAVVRSVRQSVS
jgi:hypothetical protein